MNPPGRKALFLDRDGTLIVDKDYLADPAGVEVIPGVVEGLRRARELGYLLFLFTNQSGIGRGYHTLAATEAVNARMESMIGLGRPLFAETCIAPEAPDQPSVYRKPSPRFIVEAAARHALDPQRTWMIGDKPSDIEAGVNAGVRIAAVATGKLTLAEWRAQSYPGLQVHADLAEFARGLD